MNSLSAICTFNFDDSIEIEDTAGRFEGVFDDSRNRDQTKIPIYHVHGFLPRDQTKKTSADFVFSEDDYHRVYSEPYHWSNLVQANLLSHDTCLFIGLSFSDPNLRRLIDATSTARRPDNLIAICRVTEKRSIMREAMSQSYSDAVSKFHEELYANIGVRCLFVDDYDDIPLILRAVRSAQADPVGSYVSDIRQKWINKIPTAPTGNCRIASCGQSAVDDKLHYCKSHLIEAWEDKKFIPS